MNSAEKYLGLILLNIGYSELNGNWNWKGVHSPFARIYYVQKGEARIRIKDDVWHLKPNHIYLIPPFTLHDDECDKDFSSYYIHFYERAIDKVSIFDTYGFPVEIGAKSFDLSLIRRLFEINPNRGLKYYDPRIYDNPTTFSQDVAINYKMPLHLIIETQGILSQLMSRFIEFKEPKLNSTDSRVNDSLRFIHENVDKNITIESLAAISCITNDHFIRIFKKEMGCTPLQYIIRRKIEKAQLLLLTTDMTIRTIALELNFDNISYFNRLFKSHVGKTPSMYREEYNDNPM